MRPISPSQYIANMKRIATTIACMLIAAAGLPQATDDLRTNAEIAEQIRQLAQQGGDTYDQQVRLVWVLVMRSVQGDPEAHKHGKPAAERLAGSNELNPRARFAYGFLRYKEAFDTRDPVTRKRRIDEGRRAMTESLPMGARDGDFCFDAGFVLAGLPADANLYREAANTLAIARRLFGDKFAALEAPRRADWEVAMAAALEKAGIIELAREHYQAAYSVAPDSPSGRMAQIWLRTHGG